MRTNEVNKSIDRLMNINAMINSDGGVNFIKIRMLFEDIDRLAGEGNEKALQFKKELDRVHDAVFAATQMEFDKA